jgi:hypothetical protein
MPRKKPEAADKPASVRPWWRVLAHPRTGMGPPALWSLQADYHRIVDGALIFRNYRGPDQYPETVHVFAAGHWMEMRSGK